MKITDKMWDAIFDDLMTIDKTELVQGIIERMTDEDAMHYIECSDCSNLKGE